MGKILGFVQEVKYDISKKRELEASRNEVIERLKNGHAFFGEQCITPKHGVNTVAQVKYLQSSSKNFMECVDLLLKIDNDIREIDNSIIMKLESFFSDFVIRFEMAGHTDQTGDRSTKKIAMLVPFYSDSDFTEITPEDLKLVLFLRDKFQIRNFNVIEPISKETYYSGG